MTSFVYVRNLAAKNSSIGLRKTSHRTVEGWLRATGAKEHKISHGPITTYCYRLPNKRLVEVAVLDPETVHGRITVERALNDPRVVSYLADKKVPRPWRAKALHDALVRQGVEITLSAKKPHRGAGSPKGKRKPSPKSGHR